ncbi:DUF523 and DUF1722 domain-containing protein [Neptunicella marina]|uniref:DUF1722 domain-containing protein n=1 Tax=Neptunicella marina TaxID=2125989 RepID=A0A8J6IR85_9ALTE|nr:DUF523 and DUF1722 domain-containing protein [Neptunicella marina]MBC3764432.1 DUF1722 domain-containing protein [Neptunicella marina]
MTQSISATTDNKPVLGISACLTGAEVRYNGGHKLSRYCNNVLSRYFEFKPMCPEVAIGLPTPRAAIRVVSVGGQHQVHERHDASKNYAPALQSYAETQAPFLQHLSGFIFMQKSPSCAVGSATLYTDKGMPMASTHGAFAEKLMQLMPCLPVVEAGALNDSRCRENFLLQVFAYHEWQTTVLTNPTLLNIQRFHHRYKLLLRSHSESVCKMLGQKLARTAVQDAEVLVNEYIVEFMQAMKKLPKPQHHASLLMRIYKGLKQQLSGAERQQSITYIDHYRNGIVPFIVPMTLLNVFREKYQCRSDSAVWDAYPFELGLQNAI